MEIALYNSYQLLIWWKGAHLKTWPTFTSQLFVFCGHYDTKCHLSHRTSVVSCLPEYSKNVQGHTYCKQGSHGLYIAYLNNRWRNFSRQHLQTGSKCLRTFFTSDVVTLPSFDEVVCIFRWVISRPQVLNLRYRNQIRGKLLLSRKLWHFRGSCFSQRFIPSTSPHYSSPRKVLCQ